MNNAEKFKQLFGIYATELWAMPEVDFLKWLNEKVQLIQEDTTSDPIDRQAAIDAEGLDEEIRCEMCRNPMHTSRGCDGNCTYDEKLYEKIMQILDRRIKQMLSAQPETILCKDCKHRPIATRADEGVLWGFSVEFPDEICPLQCEDGWYNYYPKDDFYCANAERRTDE